MEYFNQFIHPANDTSFLILVNDINNIIQLPQFTTINNVYVKYQVPTLHYTFKPEKTYFIKFYIKQKDNYIQNIKFYLANLKNENNDITATETISNIVVPQTTNLNNNYTIYTTIFSPMSQYNTLVWDLNERNSINQNFNINIDDVEIYQMTEIPLFENIQNTSEKIITKIAIQGQPGTFVSLNRGKVQIPFSGIYETPYGVPIQSVAVASTDLYIIDYTYEINEEGEQEE